MWPLDKHAWTVAQDTMRTSVYPHDGFVLTPEYGDCSGSGTAEFVLKLKDTHTLDLRWTDTGLWYGDGADYNTVHTLRPTVELINFPAARGPVTPVVVEAAATMPSPSTLHLTFLGVRPGKLEPNNVRCVTRTLVSVQEAATLESVVQALESVQDRVGPGGALIPGTLSL